MEKNIETLNGQCAYVRLLILSVLSLSKGPSTVDIGLPW